ncbi:GNAT family N-acetyltransferase [Ktedonospora formicarum]|uniref:GNAT family acetyltransferase n=1 Tax=Ktedonospora formicarum TaxID=2778364 RepID=A0A8J3MPM5_9CHLR|nr:GNAT family N-acetyltransferase [Ktedonospora formicarum]GHO43977.1 GNAT family acetyltransferase [Ktedonospora formicarum]
MSQSFSSSSLSNLALAAEANMREAAALWGRLLGAKLHTSQEADWFHSGVSLSMFNGVICAQLESDHIDEQIEHLLKPFRDDGLPVTWLLGPTSRPNDLESRLIKHGLHLDQRLPAMMLDLQTLPMDEPLPSGITVKLVENQHEMENWIHVVATGSGFPDFIATILLNLLREHGYNASSASRPYLALRDGEPVASSLLVPGGGIAGIYCVCTLENARRQGIGRTATIAALRDARDHGYRLATLQSSEMGYRIYRRLGFQEVCTLTLYTLPATTWSPS